MQRTRGCRGIEFILKHISFSLATHAKLFDFEVLYYGAGSIT